MQLVSVKSINNYFSVIINTAKNEYEFLEIFTDLSQGLFNLN